MKRNMLIRRAGSLLIIRENKENPTNYDWDELITFLAEHKRELQRIKILVRTDGGVATAPQRKRLEETLGQNHVLVAVVSDAMMVRFAGATIALFQKNYRQFTIKELGDAYNHLKLTIEEKALAEKTLRELESQLYSSDNV